MEPVEDDIAIGTTPVEYITQGTLSAINQYWDTQALLHGTQKTTSAVRMLDIEDFDYNEEKNLLTFVDEFPMYIPQQALDEPSPSTMFEREVNHRLDRMIYVRNEATGNTVTFTYQSLQYTVKAHTTKPSAIECHYVVQPGSTWNSKLHNDKGQALKLILTYEIIQA